MEGSLVQKRAREELEVAQKLFEENKDVVDFFDEEFSSSSSSSSSKRHKPYNHILSLLELEEEDSTQDLSPLITTLQKEITSCDSSSSNNDQNTLLMNPSSQGKNHNNDHNTTNNPSTTHLNSNKEDDDEKERVMRHLLQASDDELGIPSTGEFDGKVLDLDFGDEYGFGNNNRDYSNKEDYYVNDGDHGFSSLCDKLWEIEDEAANYYALLQSELFLWEQ